MKTKFIQKNDSKTFKITIAVLQVILISVVVILSNLYLLHELTK